MSSYPTIILTNQPLLIHISIPDNAPRAHKASSSWEAKLHDLIWSYDDDQPRFRHEKWRRVFDEQIESNPAAVAVSTTPLFALPIGEHVHEWTVWLSKEDVWKRYSTLSQIAILKGEEREVSSFSFLSLLEKQQRQQEKHLLLWFCDSCGCLDVLLIISCAPSRSVPTKSTLMPSTRPTSRPTTRARWPCTA